MICTCISKFEEKSQQLVIFDGIWQGQTLHGRHQVYQIVACLDDAGFILIHKIIDILVKGIGVEVIGCFEFASHYIVFPGNGLIQITTM